MGHAQIEQPQDETRQVPDTSGRPQGGPVMPYWKHYRPAPAPLRLVSEA